MGRNMQAKLWRKLLELRRALEGVGAVVTAVDQQQRDADVAQALPHRGGVPLVTIANAIIKTGTPWQLQPAE